MVSKDSEGMIEISWGIFVAKGVGLIHKDCLSGFDRVNGLRGFIVIHGFFYLYYCSVKVIIFGPD